MYSMLIDDLTTGEISRGRARDVVDEHLYAVNEMRRVP